MKLEEPLNKVAVKLSIMKLKYTGLLTTCSLNVINYIMLKVDKYKVIPVFY